MTEEELECKVKLDDKRKRRIARGSGTSLILIQSMIDNFKQIKTLVNKFGKMKMGNNMKDALRNPKML